MKTEAVVNGGISIIIVAENPMEEELLKALAKQQNDITQINSNIMILNKSIVSGIIIGKRLLGNMDKNDSQEKTV